MPEAQAVSPGGRRLSLARLRERSRSHAGPPSWVAALAVALAGTVALVALDALVGDEPVPRGDDLVYERMADDPFAPHTFPFAYRVLVPWLVHVLPFSHTLSFSLVAWLASGAAGGCLYLLLVRLGAPRALAAGLALALVLSPPLLVVGLRQGRNPDAVSVLVMVAGTLFAVERRAVPLALTLAVGALTRESAMFLVPFAYALWARRRWDPRVALRVLAVALPAVGLYVGLRLAIPTVGREQVPGYGSLLGGRVEVLRSGLGSGLVELRRLATVYGPLWLVAPFALRGQPFARRGLVLVALCAVAMTFALDWGRIALLAAPVVYGASAWVLTRAPRLRAPVLVCFAALVVAYAAYMAHGGVQHGIIDAPPPPYPVR